MAMPKGTKNKYGARKVKADGFVFDSLAEYSRYCELVILQKTGAICGLQVHPKFELRISGRPVLSRSDRYPGGRKVSVKWDFSYIMKGEGIVYEDVKSPATITEAYRLRRAIFEALYYPARVVEIMSGRKTSRWVRHRKFK